LSQERKRLANNAQRVADTLAAMAFTPISDVFTKDGTLTAPADMPYPIALAVNKIRRKEILGMPDGETGKRQVIGHIVDVEMVDKVQPLCLLASSSEWSPRRSRIRRTTPS
jgi:hypothetical protein